MKRISLSLLAVLGAVVSTQAMSQITPRATAQPIAPRVVATPTPASAQIYQATPQYSQQQAVPALQGVAPQQGYAPSIGNDGTNSGTSVGGKGPKSPSPKQPDPSAR